MGCQSIAGLPPAVNSPVPIIHLGGERHYESKVSCPRTQRSAPARARTRTARPEFSALTIRSPRLPSMPSIEINKFKKGLLGFEEKSSFGHTRRLRFGHYGVRRSLKFLSISSKIKIDLNRKNHHVYCL